MSREMVNENKERFFPSIRDEIRASVPFRENLSKAHLKLSFGRLEKCLTFSS
jgi:hypothetical protein